MTTVTSSSQTKTKPPPSKVRIKPIDPKSDLALHRRRYVVVRLKKKNPTLTALPYTYEFSELVAMEKNGINASEVVHDLEQLGIPKNRGFEFLNIPKATAHNKITSGKNFVGIEALASIRIKKMLALAESIASNSLHPDAKNFDSGKWLGEWIERPQPALGGRKPTEFLNTETGGQRILQLLGALESGSYQ
jgi:uncharacterized protein (DUF2384 family)